MSMIENINVFVDTMIESEKKFQELKTVIDQRNEKVNQVLVSFQNNIQKLLRTRQEVSNPDMQTLYDNACKDLHKLLQSVVIEMQTSQKGMEFIQKYEQSFNVAVFGKVKAGKSYLGNFIMGNGIRDLGIATSYDKLQKPTVEVHDRGTTSTQDKLAELSEEGNAQFRVDSNEATSAIQLFRLGGLTWFDTPGIGSVTWENEMLAKDYVTNADLVVFTSNSDAAGTRQDFEELKKLYKMGKPFVLLLTQSDTFEEDCDEEGDLISVLCPKSEADRQATENYIRQTFAEIGLGAFDQGKILTISTKLGLEALKTQNESMFEQSHMGDFLKTLTDITKTEGAELKLKTPGNRMNQCITTLVENLDEANQAIATYGQNLHSQRKKLSTHNEILLEQMQTQCDGRVRTLILQKVSEIQNNGGSFSETVLADLITKEIFDVILGVCAGEFAASEHLLSDFTDKLRVEGVGKLEMQTDTIHYTTTEVERVLRDPKGWRENVGAFFGKEYYKSVRTTQHHTKTFDIGVNEQQVLELARAQVKRLFETEAPAVIKQVSEHYIQPMLEFVEFAQQQIADTKRNLEQLKC